MIVANDELDDLDNWDDSPQPGDEENAEELTRDIAGIMAGKTVEISSNWKCLPMTACECASAKLRTRNCQPLSSPADAARRFIESSWNCATNMPI